MGLGGWRPSRYSSHRRACRGGRNDTIFIYISLYKDCNIDATSLHGDIDIYGDIGLFSSEHHWIRCLLRVACSLRSQATPALPARVHGDGSDETLLRTRVASASMCTACCTGLVTVSAMIHYAVHTARPSVRLWRRCVSACSTVEYIIRVHTGCMMQMQM